MRSWLMLALLAAAVVGLGAWVYYDQLQAGSVTTYAVSSLKPAAITRARLERRIQGQASLRDSSGGPSRAPGFVIVLERQGETWRMTFPVAARADRFQVDRLLSIVEARSSARYPLEEPARFGLDHPDARLTIDGETFNYGAISETTREQYVAARDMVYVLPLSYVSALPRNPDVMLAREVLAPTEVPVRFEFADFTLWSDAGVWRIDPATVETSADERNAWAAAWRQASAFTVSRHDGRVPAEKIKIGLAGGQTIEIGILQREPELVLVRLDEEVQYRFFGPSAKRLVVPPGGAARAEALAANGTSVSTSRLGTAHAGARTR